MEPSETGPIQVGNRLHYAFVLRDPLPLKDRWTNTFHNELCHREGCSLDDEYCQRADQVRLWRVDSGSSDTQWLLDHLDPVIDELMGLGNRPERIEQALSASWQDSRTVAVVTSPWRATDTINTHHRRCFSLLNRVHSAIVLATGALVAPLAIERCAPMYLILRDVEGTTIVETLVLATHAFDLTDEASREQLELASGLLTASTGASPAVRIRGLMHSVDVALRRDGDYLGVVLRSAMAAELLAKEVAWVIAYERELTEMKSPIDLATNRLFDDRSDTSKYFEYLKRVLSGDWSSQDPDKPVGAWLRAVSRMRTQCLHFGGEPTADEADDASIAVKNLSEHICNCLYLKLDIYPNAAVTILGDYGIVKRGGSVSTSSLRDRFVTDYTTWKVTKINKFDGTYGSGSGPIRPERQESRKAASGLAD